MIVRKQDFEVKAKKFRYNEKNILDTSNSFLHINGRKGTDVHEDTVMSLMEKLVIADDRIIGEIMAGWGLWKAGQSARVQASKYLKINTDLGRLEKGEGFYRLPGIKSQWTPHNMSLSKAISEILIPYPQSIVFREHSIQEVGLRPDALIMAINGTQATVIVLEIMNNETEEYFTQKENAWISWEDSKKYLSNLFGYEVNDFSLIPLKGQSLCANLPLLS